jgi:RNA polymerase sigma factor (sigma-70 family)
MIGVTMRDGLEPHSIFEDWEFLHDLQVDLEHACRKLEVSFSDESEKARVKSLSSLLLGMNPWPDSWQKLGLGVWTDLLLTNYIAACARRRLKDATSLEAIVESVRSSLFHVCLRNADKWYRRRRDYSRAWRGFLLAHVPSLVSRAATKEITASAVDGNSFIADTSRPEDILIASEAAESVRAAMNELTEEERALVELRFVDITSIADIARQKKLSYSTAADRINRAVEKLRELVSNFDRDRK